MTHELKELPEYYQAVFDGRKTFEVRFNDRDYKVGDTIILKEWNRGKFTGREMSFTITYILDDEQYCKPGYVIIGFAHAERVQIFNMVQHGNNNVSIANCGTINL